VSTVHESFEKYIGFDKPAYEKVDAFQQEEAIELILNAGGVPVLAHPDRKNIEEMIQPLISMGLKGLEVYHSKFDGKESAYFLSIAQKYNLLITGGSDCHGNRKFKPLLGKVKLPYQYVDKLKESATAIKA
jgi:predicted metal-dependent phosphoesterase TrpH